VSLVHIVVPGTHTPPQVPPAAPTVPTQASAHAVAVPHWPVMSHVAICVSLVHVVVPGTHTPPQLVPTVPTVPTHASVHVVAVPHWPVMPHVSTCVSLVHFVVPGTHTPPQFPPSVPTQTFVHAVDEPHWPVMLHVSTLVLPAEPSAATHWVLPGLHVPAHAPLTHAWFVQGVAAPHVPFEHVWMAEVPEHCVALPVHAPEHMPSVQPLAQATGSPHAPLALHVSTPSPPSPALEHWVAPGVHASDEPSVATSWPESSAAASLTSVATLSATVESKGPDSRDVSAPELPPEDPPSPPSD
jgi:hypothetical protein